MDLYIVHGKVFQARDHVDAANVYMRYMVKLYDRPWNLIQASPASVIIVQDVVYRNGIQCAGAKLWHVMM